MAHPKRKTSKTRRDKRRTHYKLDAPNVVTCKTTGEPHLMHRAYQTADGDIYYRGKIFIQSAKA